MVSTIIKKLKLNDEWLYVNLNNYNDFYLIAIKGNKEKKDNINPSDVKKIKFEVGIESGIKNQPLTVDYISVNFDDTADSSNKLNKISAFARFLNFPNQFYIKPVALEVDSKNITTGEVAITVNVNAVDLGA